VFPASPTITDGVVWQLTGSAGSETSVQPDPPGNILSVPKGSTDLFI